MDDEQQSRPGPGGVRRVDPEEASRRRHQPGAPDGANRQRVEGPPRRSAPVSTAGPSPSALGGLEALSAGRRSRRRGRTHRSPLATAGRVVVRLLIVVVVLAVAAGIAAGVQLSRPVPRPVLTLHVAGSAHLPGTVPAIPWPKTGVAALDVPGVGMLESPGASRPVPIASVTKVMVAYVILQDHPLQPYQPGPSIPVTTAAVSLYQAEKAVNDSVVAVVPRETLTEVQALEALLVPSADNIAVLLADWDAGSEAAFVAKMNAEAAKLGLHHTHYADVSGLDATTVSTPADQIRLAELAMRNPIFAAIVGFGGVTLPDNKKVLFNYNYDLGRNGIVGVKTGSDGPAGGCFVAAADARVDGRKELVYAAVFGAQSHTSIVQAALDDGSALITAARGLARSATVVHAGTVVGAVSSAWGVTVPVRATASATFVGFPGEAVDIRVLPAALPKAPVAAGTRVGTLLATLGTLTRRVPLVTAARLDPPTLRWRLLR